MKLQVYSVLFEADKRVNTKLVCHHKNDYNFKVIRSDYSVVSNIFHSLD